MRLFWTWVGRGGRWLDWQKQKVFMIIDISSFSRTKTTSNKDILIMDGSSVANLI